MGRPKKGVQTSPTRLTTEALRWAKIASSYTGEAIVDYVSRIVIERAKQDAERLHAQMSAPKKPKGGE